MAMCLIDGDHFPANHDAKNSLAFSVPALTEDKLHWHISSTEQTPFAQVNLYHLGMNLILWANLGMINHKVTKIFLADLVIHEPLLNPGSIDMPSRYAANKTKFKSFFCCNLSLI